jgi:hypothetical protein
MKVYSIILLATLSAPTVCFGAEYYIYKDAAGSLVLSNLPAAERPAKRAPESLALANVYNLPEVTAEEIAATEKQNLETTRLNELRDITAQMERLAEEVRRLSELTQISLQRPVEINQVAVTQGVRFRSFGFRHR